MSDHTSLSRRRLTLGAAAAVALPIAGCDQLGIGIPSVIKVGVAQPLSGGLKDLGQDMLNGVKLAVDELNGATFKIKGKPVTFEIVSGDDKANAEEGEKVARTLVDAGIVAVVGHLNSGVSIKTAPIYAEKSIAQLAISTNPKFTELGFPTTLRLVANDNLQAKAVGSYAASSIQGTKFAVIDDGTPYGKGLADAAAVQLKGKTIAHRQSFDDKTKDFAALAEKLKADGIEVVLSTLSDFQIIALIDFLKKNGHNTKITIMGTDTLKTGEMVKHSADVAGMYCTSPVLEATELPGGRAFLEAYEKAFKKPPTYGGHYSYDAMQVIAQAVRRAASGNPAKVLEALRRIDPTAPVTNSMKWDAKGEQRYGVVSVYAVRGGRWESLIRSDTW
jgi:branched-chain amino acid transport system substrate-binding protein